MGLLWAVHRALLQRRQARELRARRAAREQAAQEREGSGRGTGGGAESSR